MSWQEAGQSALKGKKLGHTLCDSIPGPSGPINLATDPKPCSDREVGSYRKCDGKVISLICA